MYLITVENNEVSFTAKYKNDVAFLVALLELNDYKYDVMTIQSPSAICIPSDFGLHRNLFPNWRF